MFEEYLQTELISALQRPNPSTLTIQREGKEAKNFHNKLTSADYTANEPTTITNSKPSLPKILELDVSSINLSPSNFRSVDRFQPNLNKSPLLRHTSKMRIDADSKYRHY